MSTQTDAHEGPALVTGFPGWLGNRVVKFLQAPHPDFPGDRPRRRFTAVRALVLPGTDLAELRRRYPDVETVEGDVRDAASVSRLFAGTQQATVFHMAGIIHPRRIRDLFEINTVGTQHVIAAAAAADARQLIAVSSNSPAGVSRDPSVLFDESTPDRPYMQYGASKKAMEDDLRAAHASGAVATTIVRPCWFYGPDQPPRQSEFFSMIRRGKAPILGDGESRRSMSYVDNTSLGLLLAASSPIAAGETYWIADARPYSMNEIVDTVEDLLETEFDIEVAHRRLRLPSIASEVARVADALIQRTGFYQQKVHVLSEMNKTIACSIDKARDALGYAPAVELREGMRRSIEWCLAEGHEI